MKPVTRGDCVNGPRPCPWECRYRLEGAESCVLDVADRGGLQQVDIAQILGLSVSRAQQIEEQAVAKLAAGMGFPVPAKSDYVPDLFARKSSADADALDDAVLEAVGALRTATPAVIESAVGRKKSAVGLSLERLVDEGRLVQVRLPKIQKAFAYELPEQEAAE